MQGRNTKPVLDDRYLRKVKHDTIILINSQDTNDTQKNVVHSIFDDLEIENSPQKGFSQESKTESTKILYRDHTREPSPGQDDEDDDCD